MLTVCLKLYLLNMVLIHKSNYVPDLLVISFLSNPSRSNKTVWFVFLGSPGLLLLFTKLISRVILSNIQIERSETSFLGTDSKRPLKSTAPRPQNQTR